MTDEKKDPKVLLADAIKKRDDLNTFIKVLQEMIGTGTSSESEASEGGGNQKFSKDLLGPGGMFDPLAAVYPGMFFGKSQPQAAKIFMELCKRPMKLKTIIEGMEKGGCKVGGKKPMVNLWGILNRDQDTFIRVPKAGWGLVEWYEPSVIAKFRREGKDSEENDAEEN